MLISGPYSLLVCASYFISRSLHAGFSSVLCIWKWCWGCRHFWISCISMFYRSYHVNNKVIDALYILMYYYTGILFVVTRRVGFVHKFICRKPAATCMNENCLNPFSQLLYSSFYTKMIISKSTIIIKYWRNISIYKIYSHFYLLKLPACGFKGPKNNTNQYWTWNTTLPYKFVSPWSFVHVTAGFLQINLCTKPTLPVTLQTKFQYSSTLKCIVHRLSYY